MKKKFEMREATFNVKNITQLSGRIKNSYSQFNDNSFLEAVLPKLGDLQLKERSDLITEELINHLPSSFKQSVKILLNSLPNPVDRAEETRYDLFIVMPLANYVSTRGLHEFELSAYALKEMTKCFSSEFAIRYFIDHYPAAMQKLFAEWAKDDNVHVRRLVSEGTRPRLPWAFRLTRFIDDPKPVIEMLTLLKDDPELYVRRSVANNLNDISKDHPDTVVNTLRSWQNGTKEMAWLTKHSLRTLLKRGYKGALDLLGYSTDADIRLNSFALTKDSILKGDSLEFSAELISNEDKPVNAMIDFIIWYQKANGSLAPKVFKLTTKILRPNTKLSITKSHAFGDYTTRRHHIGPHEVGIQVNGAILGKLSFQLC